MLLNFVLAEAALELVPEELRRSPAVVADARRRGKNPSEVLLDRSFHHSSMVRLKDSEKRGRPDLVHVAMLAVTGTPLYLEGKVKLYVHTCAGRILDIDVKTRVPKNYLRFRGLMEKTLAEKPREGLLKVESGGVQELIRKIGPEVTVGLSVQGKQVRLEDLARRLGKAENPCAIVGGFPHGHFSQKTLAEVDELVRIDPRPLEAHVVASRLVYEVEKAREVSTINIG